MSKTETKTDPRIEALARALRDEEEGTVGWWNTTENHQRALLRRAERLITFMDANS
jgi:hypothetical protein